MAARVFIGEAVVQRVGAALREQVREVDAVGLGGELEVFAVGVEGSGAAGLVQPQIRLVLAVHDRAGAGGCSTAGMIDHRATGAGWSGDVAAAFNLETAVERFVHHASD
ncbi:MAG: hypothetical protein EA400_18050 [Chromatiaceae bacterium]|nr:MAG: hypothetical protein EA400_18050 [Chromatiaceae bacterium]